MGSIEEVLLEERLIGYLDPGAEIVLARINRPSKIVSTSSCTGRITLIEGEAHWLRNGARVAYKTHHPISRSEVERVLRRGFTNLWLKVTGPILHLRVEGWQCAKSLLEAARRNGFKHSGVISITEDSRLVVEIMSSQSMSVPLVMEGARIIGDDALDMLIEKANTILVESRIGLDAFSREVEELVECF
ncbi:tRNA(Phe) 7-((3-amino-3-carboxypropyl)-4-demethylwyosine(37)-N(4))-methyltransferase [Aeropyrum pernix]|uniref:tRNA(Phe) 7-((3-amino-3-carboxypropyl)-4-demethylwyosine(37)-N(4))-methyltransferase n=1 Tax=Aeropyrum pernix TaxID=56636 RepID=A0A401H9F6_AERPX|nr:hypothetical protein [Aeropyrum pernix]GBF09071.1 tRNA(Phe) 7-((3-amino-3-carboxypropyl)-4-demethylwyosine(37)-N(4))-methyltransferase [Aeropyrum pernix]